MVRNFWDAAVCRYKFGIEGIRRIDAIFAAAVVREQHVRTLVDAWSARLDA